MSERWKPETGAQYYFLDSVGEVVCDPHGDFTWMRERIAMGNYFKTEAEAKSAREKVKDLLLSLHESTQAATQDATQAATQDEQLPDWCKVGAWVYDKAISKYSQVAAEDTTEHLQKVCKFISKGEIVQSRLRPYNAEEMKALVGKVIENWHHAHLIIGFIKPDPAENLSAFIRAGQCWIAADRLLSDYTLDGKPCGVLEHLENGEWVK